MNEDVKGIFEKYALVLEQEQQTQAQSQGKPLGQLVGATGGGKGGNWGGSMPKLISLLPFGIWKPSSLKRPKQNSQSGLMSDHYEGNTTAYAADFGLNTTFGTRVEDATRFAIAVARNAGANISSWEPFKGNSFKHETPDGYRVQIIWQSNVGGNHYDHVHVGVKKGAGAATYRGQEDDAQNADTDTKNQQQDAQQSQQQQQSPYASMFAQYLPSAAGGFTKEKGAESLKGIMNTGIGAIEALTGKKLF